MNTIMQSPLFHDSPWRNRGAENINVILSFKSIKKAPYFKVLYERKNVNFFD
jgi:hypothetical protein